MRQRDMRRCNWALGGGSEKTQLVGEGSSATWCLPAARSNKIDESRRQQAAPATKTRQQEWRWSLTGGLATALVFAVSVTNFGELPTIELVCSAVHLLATVTTRW